MTEIRTSQLTVEISKRHPQQFSVGQLLLEIAYSEKPDQTFFVPQMLVEIAYRSPTSFGRKYGPILQSV